MGSAPEPGDEESGGERFVVERISKRPEHAEVVVIGEVDDIVHNPSKYSNSKYRDGRTARGKRGKCTS